MDIRFTGVLLLIVWLQGCTTLDPAHQALAGHNPIAPIAERMVPAPAPSCPSDKLAQLSTIHITGGKDTSYLRGTRISNANLTDALQRMLDQMGLMHKAQAVNQPGYELHGLIIDNSHTVSTRELLAPESVTAQLETSYRLVNPMDQQVLWQQEFNASHRADYQQAQADWYILTQLAYEGAANKNLQQLAPSLCQALADASTHTRPPAPALITDQVFQWPDDKTPSDSELRLYLGSFSPDNNGDILIDRGHGYVLGIGLSYPLAFNRYSRFDFDFQYINREYATNIPPPLFSQIDDDMTLESAVFTGGLSFNFPVTNSLDIYLGAGLGLFLNKLRVTGTTFGIPGSIEDNDTGIAWYSSLGVAMDINDSRLAIEYKRQVTEARFEKFNLNELDIGGRLLNMSYAIYF